MSKSAARKKIEHQLRQNPNGFDPRKKRGHWGGVKPVPRIKPNRRRDEVRDHETSEASWN